jgi:hypothetical protein
MNAVQFRGGPHDGERVESPPADPFPERLFAIDFRDGAKYARTGAAEDDAMVFAFDADGSLTRRARVTFGELPEDAD